MESVPLEFRALLKEELLSRCKRNAAYSARAMARDLKVSPGFLSQLLSGKRHLSEGRSHEIADRLDWDRTRKRIFTTLVRYENASTPPARERIYQELRSIPQGPGKELAFADVNVEYFRAISDWYHMAILELSQVEGFRADPRWIGRRLGIRITEAETAIARLKLIGMLVDDGKGGYHKASSEVRVADVPSSAIREFHRQMLDRSRAALETQAFAERDITGTTMAIDPEKLPQARELIRNFRWQLMEFLESGRKRSVYQLSVQLFRLDSDKKGKK